VKAWLLAFCLTVLVEQLVAFPLLAVAERSWGRRLGLIFFAQLASHPAVCFIFPELPLPPPVFVVVAETWAVVSEIVFYLLAFPALDVRRALAISCLANGASFGLGLVLQRLGWL
jgi:hypothetical protein